MRRLPVLRDVQTPTPAPSAPILPEDLPPPCKRPRVDPPEESDAVTDGINKDIDLDRGSILSVDTSSSGRVRGDESNTRQVLGGEIVIESSTRQIFYDEDAGGLSTGQLTEIGKDSGAQGAHDARPVVGWVS